MTPRTRPTSSRPSRSFLACAGLCTFLAACSSPAPGEALSFSVSAPPAAQERDGSLAAAPLAKSEAEGRILAVLAEMEADQSRRHLSVSRDDGRLMRQLAEAIGAETIVEVGTSTGYSGLWLALALRSTGGHLYTHELDPGRAATARENFEKAGASELVTVIVGDAHETVKQHESPIDLVFLDADKQGYVDYLEKLLPHLRPGGLVLAHNMRRPTPDPRYIEAITTDPALDTSFVLMDGAGLGITLKKR